MLWLQDLMDARCQHKKITLSPLRKKVILVVGFEILKTLTYIIVPRNFPASLRQNERKS